ncbi:MAG: response regulator [Abditibacteriales bacterium]|nr:response regulator [Abditibacteriales bacterium]MDW8365711.1 response regulator [Abditibacteriales bacterium]
MKTILVVEDDPHQGLLYEQELMDEGYRVLRAMDGCEAIKMVEEHCPDCIVLDINLPVVNGLDALSIILHQQPGLPVIINTAYACYQDDFRSWAADAFVLKSSNLTELKACIKASLEKAQSASPREE